MKRRLAPALLALLALVTLALTVASRATAQPGSQGIPASHLAAAIAAASPGDTIEVNGGVFYGPLHIDRTVALVGRNMPVIDGQGEGSVVRISGEGVLLEGFLIRNSGETLDREHAGIVIEASNAIIRGNQLEDTLFGIDLRRAHGALIEGNTIYSKALDVARRGDPVRIWNSSDVTLANNHIEAGRDVLLWYAERLRVTGNDIVDGRYGLHFMYSDDALIEGNRLLNNSVGVYLMYSRRMTMLNNTVASNRGPSGYGLGLKDMDDSIIVDNLFLDNRVGAYLDASPRELDSIGRFEGNIFAYNDIGIEMMPSVRRNEFEANSFIDNEEQVAIAGGGGGQPGANTWTVGGVGNYWSDYAGFDAEQDGFGDVTYRSERLFEDLMRREPGLRLFLYSPATNALDFAAKAFPVVRPQPKLEDSAPMMAPRMPVAPPLPASPDRATWFVVAAVLVAISAVLGSLPRLRRRRYVLPPVPHTGTSL
jgi:nitrous oxidase accessory protein